MIRVRYHYDYGTSAYGGVPLVCTRYFYNQFEYNKWREYLSRNIILDSVDESYTSTTGGTISFI